MDRQELYDQIAARKDKSQDYEPYNGGNGRVDKCVALFKNGTLKPGGTILDVGGSIGDLGYAVRDMFSRRVVLDIAQTPLNAALKKGNEILLKDVDREGLGLGDGEADVVTALDFIEHIVDPGKFARECFRVLKKGGQVFINTPNIQFWEHIDSLIRGKFPHTSGDREVYHGGHLAFFTYNDLCEIFGEAGFKDFLQVSDPSSYKALPQYWIDRIKPRNQQEFVEINHRFGMSNLLFKCVKP